MGFRIAYDEQTFIVPRQRRPRVERSAHLEAVRALPCIVCLASPPSEAAHIRSGSRKHGKRPTGTAEKPSDVWVLPMCARCHRIGPDAQHSGNEIEFYRRHRIDPFASALALWAASGDHELMEKMGSDQVQWTDSDLSEFDFLTVLASSRSQLDRIDARLRMRSFIAKHGKDKCDAMFAHLKQLDGKRGRS